MRSDQPLEKRLEDHDWGGGGTELWGPRHDYRESLIVRRLPPAAAAPRVLNAGCGAGSMTLKLLDAGYEVTSLDSSQGFVDALEGRLRERHPGVEAPVLRGDVTAMPFDDGAFDLVVCAEVLEHIDDDAAAVTEIARLLAPGGTLVGSVPANPWRYDWTDNWAGHRRRYTSPGLEALLSCAGLSDARIIAWGFPLGGLYHRLLYRPMLRRRLTAGGEGSAAASGPPAWAQRAARIALELDTLFLGRRPGYLGFLFSARGRRPPTSSPR